MYRAEDTHLTRDVALKPLPEVLARDRRLVESLPRKARSTSVLNRPDFRAVTTFPLLKNAQVEYSNLGE
ncbi:MAG: hypothetical protein ACE145_09425 [Terriglobia bacterium]